jgi:hypothetical protein
MESSGQKWPKTARNAISPRICRGKDFTLYLTTMWAETTRKSNLLEKQRCNLVEELIYYSKRRQN